MPVSSLLLKLRGTQEQGLTSSALPRLDLEWISMDFWWIHLPIREPMATRQAARSSHELTVVLQESTLGRGPLCAIRRSIRTANGQAPAWPKALSAEVKVTTLPTTWSWCGTERDPPGTTP